MWRVLRLSTRNIPDCIGRPTAGRRSRGAGQVWLTGLAAVACALVALAWGPSSRAQGMAAPRPTATLVKLTFQTGQGGAQDVLLIFDHRAPVASLISNDSQHPQIGFANAVAMPALDPSGTPLGVWRSMKLTQRGGDLVLELGASAPISIRFEAVAPNALRLSADEAPTGAKDRSGAAAPERPNALASDNASADEEFALVKLKYADISEVVGILTDDQSIQPNDAFQPEESALGAPNLATSNIGVAAQSQMANAGQDANGIPLGRSVTQSIGVDRRLNAIILHGPPALVAALKAKIAMLDVPVQSVSLEAMFVELTDTGARNVGIDLTNSNAQVVSASYGTGAFNPLDPVGHGLLSVSLQGAIYAQIQRGEGKIVSRPRISAQGGSTARIVTGDALPILTNITLAGVTGVTQQVQYVTVGVTLQIAPRITDDGFVTSHVFCEISSVTGYSQGFPTISQREATTSATVHDGDSFVIGGLTEEDDLASSIAPPGQVLGTLLNHTSRSRSRTRLYIVITPHIMNPAAPGAVDNSGMSDVNQALQAADNTGAPPSK
jgi:general secretion pathway protein D